MLFDITLFIILICICSICADHISSIIDDHVSTDTDCGRVYNIAMDYCNIIDNATNSNDDNSFLYTCNDNGYSATYSIWDNNECSGYAAYSSTFNCTGSATDDDSVCICGSGFNCDVRTITSADVSCTEYDANIHNTWEVTSVVQYCMRTGTYSSMHIFGCHSFQNYTTKNCTGGIDYVGDPSTDLDDFCVLECYSSASQLKVLIVLVLVAVFSSIMIV